MKTPSTRVIAATGMDRRRGGGAGVRGIDPLGLVTVVEEEDGAPEQVVAGDQEPALGLVEDHM